MVAIYLNSTENMRNIEKICKKKTQKPDLEKHFCTRQTMLMPGKRLQETKDTPYSTNGLPRPLL
jgi:hypothetical protein